MRSLWNEEEAARFEREGGELGLRVYTSRLLGREPELVLHGGGNTSVKLRERNLLGEEEDILYVKGSGWDLADIDAEGFAPVRLEHLVRLASLERLSDPEMVNELKTHCTRAGAPTPSVEAILHAVLPHRYVDHTHADAVVTVTNTPDGERRVRQIYGDRVVVVPYVMPGFDLAREVARCFPAEAGPRTIGMVLLQHGIFSFGATARESYERMIELVTLAEEHLRARRAWSVGLPEAPPPQGPIRKEVAALRRRLSRLAGRPMILAVHDDPKGRAFARHPEVGRIARQGPATPDHVIRTKPLPCLGRDVEAFARDYQAYFAEHAPHAREPKTMLDPAPRVILDPEWGLCTVGRSPKDAAIVWDIYDHTIDVILRAEALGGYRALPPRDLFDMEYWDLEQAKLKRSGEPPVFTGEVALVTGAASGIGRACVQALLRRGAAVIGLDRDEAVREAASGPAYRGLVCDLTDAGALEEALEAGVRAFGGLDMLVLNAGVFPPGRRIAELEEAEWRRVFAVNLDANLNLMREAHPLLREAPRGGRVVVMGSKNVPAPGPGAAAYSASKAALQQLARVAALEWGGDGIRINTLHPDAVFDTALWTEEVLRARAAHYGVSVEAYKRRNLLGVEVTSRDVAELAAELCGPLFRCTTGAQIPVDGGNERVV